MATITRRGGKYRAQIRREDISLSKTFSKLVDAQVWARKVESKIERGLYVVSTAAEKTTVGDLLDRYEKEFVPLRKSQNRVSSRLKTLRKAIGTEKLAALKPKAIARYRDDRLKAVGPAAIRYELGILSRVLSLCENEWGIPLPHGNPVKNATLPKLPRGRDRRLLSGELESLLGALDSNPQMQTIVLLLIETGIRRGELAGPQWQHVNLKTRTLNRVFLPT